MRFARSCRALAVASVVLALSACADNPSVSSPPKVSAPAQQPSSGLEVSASRVSWTGWFGSDHSIPSVGYSLLAQGFLQAEGEDSLDDTIDAWLHAHPDAKVVPVVDYGESPDGSRMYWAWVVDGKDSLNRELVRSGVCGSDAMIAPDGLGLLVTRAEYDAFESDLLEVEKLAKQDRLGVWK